MAEALPSRSFGAWYMDGSIPGHAPLAPSIFTGKAWVWLFSPLEDSGCEAVIEVIARALALIILPVITLLTALLIPLGLITKAIGGCFADQTSPPVQPLPTVKDSSPKYRIARNKARIRKLPMEEPRPYPQQTLDLIAPATAALQHINAQIDKIDPYQIDIEIVNGAAQTLKADPKIKQLIEISPVEDPEKHDPIVAIREKISITEARIKSFRLLFNFPPERIDPNKEVPISDNGNCLFEAFCEAAKLNGLDVGDAHQARSDAMKWINENYQSNPILQEHLLQSMIEHYVEKQARLMDEQQSIAEMQENGTFALLHHTQKSDTLKRLKQISDEIKVLVTITAKLSDEANGEKYDAQNFGKVLSLVPPYVQEMSKDKVFGGSAELFALSSHHQVCVLIHNKNEKGIIDPKPDSRKEMNPKITKNLTLRLVLYRKHYSAYDNR